MSATDPGEAAQRDTDADAPRAGDAARGCLFALMSAVVTCVLLFANGVLLSALSLSLAESGSGLWRNPQFVQFFLFVGPVVLVIVQWMMIDYVTSRLRRWPS